MAELKDLYQEAVLDHYRKPRNYHELQNSNRQAQGLNPLCGDKLNVFLLVQDGVVRDIGFVGTGCAISIASASMMTENLKGKTEAEARAVFERFDQLLTHSTENITDFDGMGNLAAFSGLRAYPVRAKCARLAWHTMRAALEQRQETASTE
ncbi:MAG TPA: SUF system NifU family Fe-S cluster assembly protein [Acidobacteriota bacterium]|nr:SUF system NifU family Fe-S cluster assembly protein [Acidobacteriota bacterium]